MRRRAPALHNIPMSVPSNLPRAAGPAFALDEPTIGSGIAAARESPRRRIIMKVHRSDTEGVQRLLNFMLRGSYARPHCHPAPESIETVAVLQGTVGFLVFAATGAVRSAHRLAAGQAGSCLVDIEPGVWHTIVPLTEDALVLEIKRGPYHAAADKVFAPWAPAEESPEAPGYLRHLEMNFSP